jgi:sec-independent protein translocase protein TatB
MGSLTFSEILTIAVIVLIVFGPNRLPELARRAGAMVTKLREASREIRAELRDEYKDTLEPLEDVRRDLRAAKADLTEAASSVVNDIEAAGTTSGPGPQHQTGDTPQQEDDDGTGEASER